MAKGFFNHGLLAFFSILLGSTITMSFTAHMHLMAFDRHQFTGLGFWWEGFLIVAWLYLMALRPQHTQTHGRLLILLALCCTVMLGALRAAFLGGICADEVNLCNTGPSFWILLAIGITSLGMVIAVTYHSLLMLYHHKE